MAVTTLSDVIVPELFNPYVVNRTMEKSAIFQSGIVSHNAEFDNLASQAAPTVNMPYFEDLTGDSEQIIEGGDLTAAKITSKKDVAAIFRRAKMWAATDLFGEGAVAYGNGAPVGFVPTETDRDKKKGSGIDYLINRRTSILHPRGVAFTNTNVAKSEGPSRSEFTDAENWSPVYEPKQIRIVEFKHKLG